MGRFPRGARRVGWIAGLLLCGLGGPVGPGTARAEGDEEKPKVPDAPLVWVRHDVSALTLGRPEFIPDRGPYPVASDQVNDATLPLFGGEGEEAVKPYGSAEDVIELIKAECGGSARDVGGRGRVDRFPGVGEDRRPRPRRDAGRHRGLPRAA